MKIQISTLLYYPTQKKWIIYAGPSKVYYETIFETLHNNAETFRKFQRQNSI